MVAITYDQANGQAKTVDVEPGHSVMDGAVRNGVEGIIAECGGACSCATCHAFVDEAWFCVVDNAGDDKADMLDFADEKRPTSRLTCQITVTEDLGGLVVEVPATQG